MLVTTRNTNNTFLLGIPYWFPGPLVLPLNNDVIGNRGIKLKDKITGEMLPEICPASDGNREGGASFTKMFLS